MIERVLELETACSVNRPPAVVLLQGLPLHPVSDGIRKHGLPLRSADPISTVGIS